ncbi:MAG: hypothetical protein Q7K57_59965 [Burkholderiaceae bacterium]|nr:hypothetical protein [Burkholderiaceae bacterium]
MVLSSISWMSARRPNGGQVSKNVESHSSHLPDGFRRPAGQWSKTLVPHATTDVRHLPSVFASQRFCAGQFGLP